MTERVAEIGYINDAHEHALISIFDPALLTAYDGPQPQRSVQVAITISSAIELRAKLDAFLAAHERTIN